MPVETTVLAPTYSAANLKLDLSLPDPDLCKYSDMVPNYFYAITRSTDVSNVPCLPWLLVYTQDHGACRPFGQLPNIGIRPRSPG